MKVFQICSLVLCFFCIEAAHAKQKHTRGNRVAATSPRDTAPTSTFSYSESKVPTSHLRVGGGLVALEGVQSEMGFGGNLGYAFRMKQDVPVYFGVDIGFARWNVNYETKVGEGDAEQTINGQDPLTSIHFLLTLYYRFMEDVSIARPYLGLSLGPSLMYAGHEAVTFAGESLGKSSSKVMFQVMLRPGVEVELTEMIGINVESRIGIFSNKLLFAPHLGVTLSL